MNTMSTPPIRLSPILPGWICSRKLTMAQAGHSLIKTSSLISLIPQALRYLIRHLGTLLKIPAELITEQQHQEFYDTFGDYCDRIFIENFAPCWPEFDIEKRTGFTMSKGIYQQELTNTETCPYIFYSMSINSDGSASACFLDWARKLIVGDAKTPSIIEGKKAMKYSVTGYEYQVSQESFWQSNISAPEVLVAAVLQYASFKAGDHLLDLYGGVGLFAGAALNHIGPDGRIDIVEGSSSATGDARANFAGIENVFVHTGDVAKEIRKFSNADVIILDPPRTGAGKDVIENLVALDARAIIYVACDPAALARDTVYLSDAGYQLAEIRSFDLFPMTHHIESIALYRPRKVS